MYFKDLITETTEGLLKQFGLNKKKFNCPNCHKANLKKQDVMSHYFDVVVYKMIPFIGSAIPAPDYKYTCAKCGAICKLVDGEYKVVRVDKNKANKD